MNIEFKVDARALKVLGSAIDGAVRRSVQLTGHAARNQLLLNLQSRILKVRSGGLINSWSGHVPDAESDGKGGWITRLSSNIAYAAIHEFGGDITPKNAQYLTIPTSEAVDRVPYSERTARRVIANPGLAGCVSTFFAKGIIFGRLGGKGAKPIPLFLLRERVTIPPRRYITLSLQQVSPMVPGIVRTAITDTVREVVARGAAGGGEAE